ncbi:sodium:proton exchanger [Methylobacterium radiotolerans]|uniref:sodium:proton exchanger n=2 Tax=Pseudomonadota TaxID=1224 RepID=UPI0005DD6F29|nr:sodium:proton exchanger [Methylobacterium radiotolerans]MBN6823978.1 sodium:proton exchanger [Methylobacterium organophilum]OXE40540.1 sodium:proton exchanger [Methylobacterium radiotolerans]GAN49845.1 sodium/calcium exchanger type membrane protein [Methylobacterium sp. ME121]
MKRFLMLVAVAVAATLPAVILRFGGWRLSPFVDVAAFGIAILAAGFLLSWGAETAEQYVSQGLILAAVALVTVLPEYAVDIYYAYMAGASGPDSRYAQYAAANMTGANRLLVGLAWPLMVALHWMKDRHRSIGLAPGNAVEVGFLLVASLYAFVIVLKRTISLVDFVVLLAIFGTYVWRVRSMQKSDNPEEAEEPGPAAALDTLSPGLQWAAMAGLVATASGVILVSAEPFAEAMVNTGRAIGLNEFLLIQWLAPLASEAPAITVAVLFVRANRAGDGLIAMISDKINQWTLLVGMLPLALSIGAGATSPLPLDTRQGEEFFLTAAQSLLGIALLLRLRFGLVSALTLAGLFAVQVGLAFVYRNDEARTITTLTWLAWTYLGLAGLLFLVNRRRLVALLRSAITGDVSDVEPSENRDDPAPRRGGREASSLVG